MESETSLSVTCAIPISSTEFKTADLLYLKLTISLNSMPCVALGKYEDKESYLKTI